MSISFPFFLSLIVARNHRCPSPMLGWTRLDRWRSKGTDGIWMEAKQWIRDDAELL